VSKVKIQSVQAIGYIELDMPEDSGGVRIFRGPNGAGKTTALLCLSALLGQKVSLYPSEGSPKGLIEGFGVTKTIGQKTTSKGDVDAVSLEGRFSFSDLVEPSVKDPVARNKSRIRALVGLTAKGCSADSFAELFDSPEEFKSIVRSENTRGVSDPLELADIVKKSTESVARDLEAKVEDATSRWQLAVEQSKGAKADKPPAPVAELANQYALAKQALADAEEFHRANARAVEHNAKVDERLEAHKAKQPAKDAAAIGVSLKKMQAVVADLRKQLATAEKTCADLQANFDAAIEWDDRLSEIENSKLEVSEDPLPEIEPLQVAEQAALKALEDAEEIKQRWDAAVRAKQLAESITANRERAAKLREIAQSTGKVVTKMLPKSCPLQVNENGMLGVHHEGRGHWVEIDSLSEGERWETALAVAIEAVGEGGVLPVKQEAWQSLDKASKNAVAKQCRDAKVYIVTGEVDEGHLRVEEYVA
jgi:energy-coupling factor transporter ATP-binding protein EcfA2